MTPARILRLAPILLWALGCQRAPAWERESPLQPLPTPPLGVQADYRALRFTITPEKTRLGRWLFFDARLSAGGGISCASCHAPDEAFSQKSPVSTGVNGHLGTRKAPSLVNVAWPLFDNFFRDGRAATLAEQALGPLESPLEMGSTRARTVAALAAIPGYARAFREAFGDGGIGIERIGEALSAYEATRMSGNSRFDRFDAGDASALDAREKLGREVFYGKAACTQCHLGWNFTDTRFHNLGVGFHDGKFDDPGRARISGDAKETGAFKTPTLREVARHPPYMHDGSVPTLRAVIELYDRGGDPNPWLAPQMKPLHLSEDEKDALAAFLEALNGEGYQDSAPASFPQ